ncbi:MAG: hypothetical protein WA919_02310 [Coleofasciculaceae cyanobacterium]
MNITTTRTQWQQRLEQLADVQTPEAAREKKRLRRLIQLSEDEER